MYVSFTCMNVYCTQFELWFELCFYLESTTSCEAGVDDVKKTSNDLQVTHSKHKLSGYFNHRVVTLVAHKLKRQWLFIVYFANCIRQPERKLPRPSTTWSCRYSIHWSCIFERGHTCMYIKEHAIISCRYSKLCKRITTKSSKFFVVTHSCSEDCQL